MASCEMTDGDESVIAQLKQFTGTLSEAELFRLALRALLREQKRLHASTEGPKVRTGTGG